MFHINYVTVALFETSLYFSCFVIYPLTYGLILMWQRWASVGQQGRTGCSHLGGGPGHAGSVHVLFFWLHDHQLLLLPDLFGQNADFLHLFILALLIWVVLPSSLLQLLLLLQVLQFLWKRRSKISRCLVDGKQFLFSTLLFEEIKECLLFNQVSLTEIKKKNRNKKERPEQNR